MEAESRGEIKMGRVIFTSSGRYRLFFSTDSGYVQGYVTAFLIQPVRMTLGHSLLVFLLFKGVASLSFKYNHLAIDIFYRSTLRLSMH
jgi:hypothetical protein